MKKKREKLIIAAVLAVAVLSLSSLVLTYVRLNPVFENTGVIQVDVIKNSVDDNTSIGMGDVASEEVYIKNTCQKSCYLRIRVEVPQVEGESLLKLGKMTEGGFSENTFNDTGMGIMGSDDEFWLRDGEYIYYVNRATGNKLLPNSMTPPIYSAIRVSKAAVKSKFTPDSKQQIVIYTEALDASLYENEESAWQ